jgi:hypothetical protein
MDDEINQQHRLVADSSAEFNRAVVNAFESLYERRPEAEVQVLVGQCYSMAGEDEEHLDSLLAMMNREPAKYAEGITRIYGHTVLIKRALDSLSPPMKARSGSP